MKRARMDQMEMDIMKMPEDMLTEIFVRLSVKVMVRLSCVCKTWRGLIIRNPDFGDRYLNHRKHLKCGIDDDETVVFLKQFTTKPENDDDKARMVILNCNINVNAQNPQDLQLVSQHLNPPFLAHRDLVLPCHGILCFANARRSADVHLYNPTTQEHLMLPPSPFNDDDIYLTENVGFGFDQSTNDYKVIRIRYVRRPKRRCYHMQSDGTLQCIIDEEKEMRHFQLLQLKNKRHIEIYKLNTNHWTTLDINLPFYHDRIIDVGIFFNGFFHWWVTNPDNGMRRILTFDFKSETFGEIGWPNVSRGNMIVLDDSLAICSPKEQMPTRSGFDVWVMQEYGINESWTKKFSVQLQHPLADTSFRYNCWVHNNNLILFGHFRKQLMVAPLKLEASQEEDQKMFEFSYSSTSSVAFRRSLVSLHNRQRLLY